MNLKQVQKGGNMILNQAMEEKNGSSITTTNESNKINDTRKQNGINKSLKRCNKPSYYTVCSCELVYLFCSII